MFALAGNKPHRVLGALVGDRASTAAPALLRRLRRTMRFVEALAAGRVALPPRLGGRCAAAFLAATIGYGVVLGGHGRTVLDAAGVVAGLGIDDVSIAGNRQTSDIDILQTLGLDAHASLIGLDAMAARQALRSLAWVEDAEVRKIYPDRVAVSVRERQAFAIWQHGRQLSLIERSGSVIADFEAGPFSDLPLFVGLGAEREAAALDQMMADWPALKDRVLAFVRVGNRRWDLRMKSGIVVKLPEHDARKAVAALAAMERDNGLLARDILAVDLRFADRVIVRLAPEAAEDRAREIEQRNKTLRAAEKRA